MGLRINQNIAAMNAYRNLSVNDGAMSKSLEKLSSGFRINRAADDAAGLSVSEGLRSQIGGLKVAVRNAQDGISVVQTAEGALTETTSILQRMRDLAVQAANGGSQDENAQAAADTEFQQLSTELDRIANTTKFGSQALLNGSYSGTFQVGANNTADDQIGVKLDATVFGTAVSPVTAVASVYTSTAAAPAYAVGDKISVSNGTDTVDVTLANATTDSATLVTELNKDANFKANYTASLSGTNLVITAKVAEAGTITVSGKGTDIAGSNTVVGKDGVIGTADGFTTAGLKLDGQTLKGSDVKAGVANAQAAIDHLDNAIKNISTARATMGAYQNRFEHTINNLNVAVENLSASESRIRDTDMAQEMVQFTRSQILSQAGTAMLAQANSAPQSVLQLLRG
jgi:flagellin